MPRGPTWYLCRRPGPTEREGLPGPDLGHHHAIWSLRATTVTHTTTTDRVTRGIPRGDAVPTPLWRRRSFRAFLVFAVALLIRIPFQASYLVNWDAVNFALGVEAFNLENHQPHPPGYLGYVLLGRFMAWVVGDPVVALTIISVVAGAVATTWVYLLGTRIASDRAALIAAALFGTSPLVWYYSEVALTYILEVALALPLVWLALVARERRSVRSLVAATVLLALLGLVRQTSLVLLLPVWAFAWLRFPRRAKVQTGALLVGLVLAWLIPLLVVAGGPFDYLRLSSQLAQLTGGATWLGTGLGILQNLAIVGTGLVLGLHVAVLAVPLAMFGWARPEPLAREHRRLLLAWALPPLLVYLLVHSGQLGYVLVIVPIAIIWAARVFDVAVGASARLLTVVAAALVAINVGGFVVLPEIAYATVTRGSLALPPSVETPRLFERGIQQVSLPRSDAHWEGIIAWAQGLDPDSTAVLAEPRDGGSFRHLSYYLPDYLVYGVGSDRGGTSGHLFTGSDHEIDYSVAALQVASAQLRIPQGVETLAIPDPHLQELLEDTLDLERTQLPNGAEVAVADVPDQSSILFLGAEGDPVLTTWKRADSVVKRILPHEEPTVAMDWYCENVADRHSIDADLDPADVGQIQRAC